MKSYFKILLLCVVALFSCEMQAAQYTVETVPMPHMRDSRQYVSNPDGILSQDTVALINSMLALLDDSLTVETAVVVVESFDQDCWDIATNLCNKYGVGKADVNNGLVITLATADRCVAFATGDGMEGVMPDAICNRIQVNHMNGLLAEGKWNEGMYNGVRVICEYLKSNGDESIIGEESNGNYAASEEFTRTDWLMLFCCLFVGPISWFFYMLIVSPLTIYRYIKGRKCPNCGESAMKVVKKKGEGKKGKNNIIKQRHCESCGHTIPHKDYYIPCSVWSLNVYQIIFSVLGRGGSGGGSSSGGGYGGGRSSGGGGRSHF